MIIPVLVGLTKTDALTIICKLKIDYRIIIEDDDIYNTDSSVKQNRINLIIKQGIIHNQLFY